ALAALEGLAAVAERLGRRRDRMETDALRALALQGLGRQAAALQALQGALDTAAPERAFRLFLDEGPAMLRLLHQVVEQGIAVQAATAILERAARRDASAHPADTLSEREMDVLRLLASGASNQDIMDALVISLGTVKSHVNHIMGKLDAQNRTEAVAKARLLGILRE
ncbi:MAG: LuxR family transcriptional regulator, partial [Anaerolineae bacterium]|nr:LuxR family transcriptional regulator [Anaerolineae bacterium]